MTSTVSISVQSPAFAEGQPCPRRYACDGENISPPLSWTGVPRLHRFGRTCRRRSGRPVRHITDWVVVNLALIVTSFDEDQVHGLCPARRGRAATHWIACSDPECHFSTRCSLHPAGFGVGQLGERAEEALHASEQRVLRRRCRHDPESLQLDTDPVTSPSAWSSMCRPTSTSRQSADGSNNPGRHRPQPPTVSRRAGTGSLTRGTVAVQQGAS
jgi:hypothetical protein